jgi:hypothetical protein
MSAARKKNLAKLKKLGFKVSPSLPTKREDVERLRPAKEIRVRILALMALFRWVVRTGEETRKSELRAAMSQSERAIYALTQAKAKAHVEQIGWKLENLWPLAWIFGFAKEPSVSGDMIDEKTIGALLDFVPDVIKVRAPREVLDLGSVTQGRLGRHGPFYVDCPSP